MKKLFLLVGLLMIFMSLTAPPFPMLYIVRSNDLNKTNIDYEISINDIQFPDIVKAQIRLESANYTSRFYREQNNLLGMRLAHNRETTAIGEGNHMAVYSSWQDCIEDYALWQKRYYKGGDYYRFLDGRYAEDKNYIKKLKKIVNDRK